MKPGFFELVATENRARAGKLRFGHITVDTPLFMPVATQATVKGLAPDMLWETGTRMIVSNTYHLMLRPGPDIIKQNGGIRGFMAWKGAVLTDSGGYQVYSLSRLRKLSEAGVEFSSHIDGSKWLLTPESALEIQEAIGSDVHMVLDEPSPFPTSLDDAKRAVDITIKWAERSIEHHRKQGHKGAIMAIVQGSVFPDLRVECAKALVEMGFDGYAAGGLALGESPEQRNEVLEALDEVLPEDKPRYLMGVGYPQDIAEAVARGFDMFDCVLPTRNARKAQVFTREGRLNLRNARFKEDQGPVDPTCNCYTCRNFSRAYLHHLFKAEEMLGPVLATLHSISFYQNFIRELRGKKIPSN